MAIVVWSGVQFNDTTRKMLKVLEQFPRSSEVYITSAVRYEPGSYHSGNNIYNGSPSGAIDIGYLDTGGEPLGYAVAKWLYQNFSADTVELINVSLGTVFAVKNQTKTNPYSSGTLAQHGNHCHWATSLYLVDRILARLGTPSAPAPVPPAPVEDLTLAQEVDFQALIWRVEALLGNHNVIGGPTRGEVNLFGG